jgi:hypothetical protein
MCKIKSRLVVALLAFGICVLGVSLWLIKSPISQLALKETKEIKEVTSEIRGFNEVVSAKDRTYVTVQGWIDPKYLCRGESDLEENICTTYLVGQSPAEESMKIELLLCNEFTKSSCIVHDQTQTYENAKLYDYNSNLINLDHQIKITGSVAVVDGQGSFRNPIGRIESINSAHNAIIPLSKIDLSLIGHFSPKGRAQDLDYNQLPVVEQLIIHNKESIPFLINKLTDETKPKERHVMDFWNDVRVGDVAFFILTDFFTDNSWEKPTIDGISFRTFLGCNNKDLPSANCHYDYIEKHGRKQIKARWQKIWNENKDKLYWDEFERCFRVNK